MVPMRIAAGLSRTSEAAIAAAEAADAAGSELGDRPCDLAVVFASAEHADGLAGVAAAAEARLEPHVLIGGVAQGVVGPSAEIEDGPGLAVWAAAFDGAHVRPFRASAAPVPDRGIAVVGWPDAGTDEVTLVLADPHTFPAGEVVEHLGENRPGHRVIGGLLTPGVQPARLVLGGQVVETEVHDGGAVGVVLSDLALSTFVSQGCRPVGEPFTVTRSEGNLVYELAGAPAVERLRELFAAAPPEDRAHMQSGLHVGIVADEYRDRFATGDFLIRAVLGADPDSGAIAVGDRVEVGQVIQFQVRDADSARQDLKATLERAGGPGAVAGALLFTCNGRGRHFFGAEDEDARAVTALTPAVAGAFCAGEIGPVGERSYLHGFTASLALFPQREA